MRGQDPKSLSAPNKPRPKIKPILFGVPSRSTKQTLLKKSTKTWPMQGQSSTAHHNMSALYENLKAMQRTANIYKKAQTIYNPIVISDFDFT